MFATENLIKWINNSEDITMLLPYLSVYMGHTDIRHTLYYIHLLPEHLRKAAKIDCDLLNQSIRNGAMIYEQTKNK